MAKMEMKVTREKIRSRKLYKFFLKSRRGSLVYIATSTSARKYQYKDRAPKNEAVLIC
jgi:hypothetical protein